MHEYSIVQALLERIDAEARSRGARSVASVRVALGRLSGVDGELLRTAFELARTGTLAAGAELELRAVDTRWTCRGCGVELVADAPLRCAQCGAPARLASGDEIVLESLELEVA